MNHLRFAVEAIDAEEQHGFQLGWNGLEKVQVHHNRAEEGWPMGDQAPLDNIDELDEDPHLNVLKISWFYATHACISQAIVCFISSNP